MAEDVGVGVVGVKYLLSVQDMARAVAFYRDTVGLVVKESSPYWSELFFGNAIVALHGGGRGETRHTSLSLTVRDIVSACDVVRRGGARSVSQPEDRGDEGIILAEFVDTEGNVVMLSQDKR